MSYILEALKRADAERQRGGVPGLHAQPGSGRPLVDGGAAAGRPWLLAGLALALLLLVVAVAGWWRAGLSPTAAPTPAAVSAAAAPPVSAAPAPVNLPAAAPPALPPPPITAAQAPPPPAPRRVPASAPVPVPPPQATPLAVPKASPPPRETPAASAVAVAAAAPAAPVRLPLWAELPEALRREIGPLSPGGSIYAEQAAARMVILNGQVFREGDTVFAELRVEQIRPRTVVLSLRGQRFELPL